MTRIVRHDAQGPALIQIGEKIVAVCQCGLSRNKPFCDGSHQKTRDEQKGTVYLYGEDGSRVALYDWFPSITEKKIVP